MAAEAQKSFTGVQMSFIGETRKTILRPIFPRTLLLRAEASNFRKFRVYPPERALKIPQVPGLPPKTWAHISASSVLRKQCPP